MNYFYLKNHADESQGLVVSCLKNKSLADSKNKSNEGGIVLDSNQLPPGFNAMQYRIINSELVRNNNDYEKSMNLNKLEILCKEFQERMIDSNTKSEMDKSEILIELGNATIEDLPKAAANGIWLEDELWGDEANSHGFYYSRKSKIQNNEPINLDFSEIGKPPHSFKEIRQERKLFIASKQ